jgi:uncharacterized protein YjiK
MKLLINLLFAVVVFCTISCKERKIKYNFNEYSNSLKLPKKLNEISGLTYLSDSTLGCIQDEKANIYIINSNSGEIISQFDFGSNADFEGVIYCEGYYFVLRSDGELFKIKDEKVIEKYNFKQSKSFDFEGICFDSTHNRLLVACKENGNKKGRKFIYIYGFSLKKNKYLKEPVFKIKKDKIHKNFKSSGIAIHPNGNIFIISSFSKTLLELSPDGEVVNKTQLNSYIFHQPEGITFDSKGDLYISNEKHKTYPTLLKYTYENQ